MLDSNRSSRNEPVEVIAVEQAGDRLVVPDAPQPGARREVAIRRAQCGGERIEVTDIGRPTRHACCRGGHCMQVHVVVVQPGEQRTPCGIPYLLVTDRRELVRDLSNSGATHPDVDATTVDLRVAQQSFHRLTNMPSSRSLS